MKDSNYQTAIFHGITAVAELKGRVGRQLTTIVPLIFHGITAVAELKANPSNPS